MLARAQKIWDEVCKPKPKVTFRVIDLRVEKVPDELPPENEIEILFVTE